MAGIGSHQNAKMKNDEWLTPPHILESLGGFDLDPCSPVSPPWKIADTTFDKNQDGLIQDWHGRVWCNPPYGLESSKWLERCHEHGNAIALIFARTETKMFFNWVWGKADAVLFIKSRLYFHYVNGERAKANSGAPSVLVAYGGNNVGALKRSGIEGKLILL